MSRSASAVVKHDGRPYELRFDACRVCLGGEFAGNIDLDVGCDASVVGAVVDGLRVQVPGGDPSGMALGNGAYGPGITLVFLPRGSILLPELPETVTLLWGESPIAEIEPTLEDSVPIESAVTYTDPSEILKTLPVSTTNFVLLAANRERWWYLAAAFMVISGALVGAALPGLELPERLWNGVLGSAMIAGGLAVAFVLARVPYQQVWLDRDRRRVLCIEGRTRDPMSKLADAPGRSLDAFHHVRVFMRWRLAQGVDEHDQEVWMVTLEGPVPFASADGLVHLHEEALMVGEFSSDIAARRVAAEVAFHTGLKILDTGHDQTS